MIRIYIDRLPELRVWYAEQMVPLIHGKHLTPSPQAMSDPLSAAFVQRLDMLSEDEVRNILLSPPEDLSKQYDWIREYIMLCDVTVFYSSFRKKHPGHGVDSARTEYINRYWGCAFFQEAFKEAHKTRAEAIRNWGNLENVIGRARERREILDGVIEQKFNYSFLMRFAAHWWEK